MQEILIGKIKYPITDIQFFKINYEKNELAITFKNKTILKHQPIPKELYKKHRRKT
jgi:hypothetical protein